MKTSLFDFELPDALIATRPANPRDSARMLVVGDALQDRCVREFAQYLREHDIVVFNDTRVMPARLYGTRGEVKVEVLLHKKQSAGWLAFARPGKRLKEGDRIVFAGDFSAELVEKREGGEVLLAFSCTEAELPTKLAQHGQMPLPPYIERKRPADAQDLSDYQTRFAKEEGSVAAPTAGLHFTEAMFTALAARGVEKTFVTLHVGAGTFLPVKVEDTSEHVMHSEFATVNEETARAVNAAKARGGRVIAVGTTSLRTLESATGTDGVLKPYAAETDIFITPGYRFKCVDMLLTNFHLPCSTLFMLVSAFAGLETMQAAYAHAIREGYRFYSYGDACLLERLT